AAPRLEVSLSHPQFPSVFPVYLMNLQPGVWSIVATPEGQLLPVQIMLDSHAFYVRWLEQDLQTIVPIDPRSVVPLRGASSGSEDLYRNYSDASARHHEETMRI